MQTQTLATLPAMTPTAFINANGITMDVDYADANPHMADDEWSRSANHYRCTFHRGRKRMTVYFSMGVAHTREPRPSEVLDALASDAAGIENASSFEDWCAEYGYDPDSRKALRVFKACERQAAKLRNFLGDDAFEVALWKLERL